MSDDERAAVTGARGPSSGPASTSGLDFPVIRALRPAAIFALVAVLAGRAVAPSLAGSGVGLGRLVHDAGVAGSIISQVFAFMAMLLAVVTIFAAARSRLPSPARIGAITLGGFAILPTIWAVHQTVPALSAALVGCGAAVLALLAAPAALRAPFARGPALVVVLVAVGGLLRLGGVALAFQAAVQGWSRLAPFARAVATAAFLADTLAVGVAIAWIAARSKRLTTPGSFLVFALALVCTRQALAGRDGMQPLDILLWRVAVRLTTRPDPAVPVAFQLFMAFLAPLVAAWALLARGLRQDGAAGAALAPLGAAVALALCAHGAVEMPPSALMLLIGSLGLALATHEGRGLWANLGDRRS